MPNDDNPYAAPRSVRRSEDATSSSPPADVGANRPARFLFRVLASFATAFVAFYVICLAYERVFDVNIEGATDFVMAFWCGGCAMLVFFFGVIRAIVKY